MWLKKVRYRHPLWDPQARASLVPDQYPVGPFDHRHLLTVDLGHPQSKGTVSNVQRARTDAKITQKIRPRLTCQLI